MPQHLEKILAHAERQLASTDAQRPTDVLPVYRKFLKIEEHRLRLRQQAGDGGREVCARRVDLVDVLLRRVFAATARIADNGNSSCPIAVIALGGYGRGELNPFSDVDVMFLYREKGRGVSSATSQIIEQVLYFLWDTGYKVGHSTRTIKEAIAAANADMVTKTAMLESRVVTGDRQLAQVFREQFRVKCVAGHEREYIEMRMRDQQARHAKFGNSVYLQEPNLKNGCGGLRDYQNLLWMMFFKEGSLTTTHLVGKDWLSNADRGRIEAAYDFLLRVRTELHYLNERATDTLHLNMQEAIAQRLRYPEERGLLRSDALMKDVYAHTRNIFRVTERITAQFVSGYSSAKTRSLFSFLPRARRAPERMGPFVIEGGQIDVHRRDVFRKNPFEMMRVIEVAQTRGLEPTPELADLFSREIGLVGHPFRYAREPREMFRLILSRKGEVGRALRLMHRLDFLGQYIPEFGQLTCLVQHEFFHRYTADEHTLVCIDKLDALASTTNPKLIEYRKLFEELSDPFVLYLALLLHDTGKAVGARPHSEASAVFAQRVARRLQLNPEERKMLILLVDHHVTLSNVAQRRNIDDPATISEFAAVVKDQRNLDALMLLTLADGQGTSDERWSDWKETLVWQLYRATTHYLADRHAFYERAKSAREARETAVQKQLGPDYEEEIEAHFEFMPDHYFRAFGVPEIVAHVELFRRFYEASCFGPSPLAPIMRWEPFPDQGHTTFTLCNWDRQQLLSNIAGSISLVPLNILSADIYTRGDNVALDVFRVSDLRGCAVTNECDMALVEATLKKALEIDAFDLSGSLVQARKKGRRLGLSDLEFPSRVSVDNHADPHFTLIEIQTPDRIGLLYDLLRCFSDNEIDIALSRISTESGAAIDTFYVTDRRTRVKIAGTQRIDALQGELHRAALPAG
ncbi:MAG: [protein-PII] uridylyltransferase [Verrucomicrobiota bacterium]|jgi:[protein-PII] uridylyltransferase